MAFVLVKWLADERMSIIPAKWVIQPTPIVADTLPVDGECYWKKRTCCWEARILAISGKLQ